MDGSKASTSSPGAEKARTISDHVSLDPPAGSTCRGATPNARAMAAVRGVGGGAGGGGGAGRRIAVQAPPPGVAAERLARPRRGAERRLVGRELDDALHRDAVA